MSHVGVVFTHTDEGLKRIVSKECVCSYWEALLFLRDVGVNVFVAPVEHQLLLLSVVHPHDLCGDLLDDVQQVLQLDAPLVWGFLKISTGYVLITLTHWEIKTI